MAQTGRLAAKRVLVRGASGFLGGALAMGLLGNCAHLRLFCRRPERLDPALRSAAVEVVAGDACDPQAVARSLREIDLVVDAVGATVPAVAPGELLPEVQRSLLPLAILLDALAPEPGRQLLYLSSGGAIYGSGQRAEWTEEGPTAPEGAYGVGKLLSEEMIRFRARRGDANYLIVRASNVYGRQRPGDLPQGVIDVFLDRAARGEALEYWGDGSQVRDYLFIDDFVAAVLALLDLPLRDEIVHVATGVGSTLEEVVATVERTVGTTTKVRAGAGSHPGVDRNVLAIAKLRSLTGWVPQYALAAGIAAAARRHRRARPGPPDDDARS